MCFVSSNSLGGLLGVNIIMNNIPCVILHMKGYYISNVIIVCVV